MRPQLVLTRPQLSYRLDWHVSTCLKETAHEFDVLFLAVPPTQRREKSSSSTVYYL